MSQDNPTTRQRMLSTWTPAALVVLAICAESTNRMGSRETEAWLRHMSQLPVEADTLIRSVNVVLRKLGHFVGYGLLGVALARASHPLPRTHVPRSGSGNSTCSLRVRAGAVGVILAFAVACSDEAHQMFLPNRHASLSDVLLDTAGALVFNLVLFASARFSPILVGRRFYASFPAGRGKVCLLRRPMSQVVEISRIITAAPDVSSQMSETSPVRLGRYDW